MSGALVSSAWAFPSLCRSAAAQCVAAHSAHKLVASPPPQVQTNGKKTPIKAMQGALKDLGDEVADIRSKFQAQLGGQGRDGM